MKKKIVICDDDVLILNVLELALKNELSDVYPVIKSRELLAIVDEVCPDILILDIDMPWLSGDDIVRELRNSEKQADLPVILMSVKLQGKQIASECGADAFLSKPFELDDLFLLVDKLSRR
ncbi:PleD family two-component system response regulator [Sphingobacterium sp.]|uniref:response regulator n=1 Tax=Sphingobacterium sp. TaxID=341027 RepID=UPI0025D9FF2C|nr:response regulator [Sphingobacterium sp.]